MKNLNKKLAAIFVGAVVIYIAGFSVASAAITKEEVINLTNKDRVEQKIEILIENALLSKAALDKANDMIKNDYFAHTSPQGISPWYWFEKNDYDYQYAGENLAIGFSDSKDQEAAWMKSSSHRKNILNPSYKEIGVAVTQGKINDSDTTIVVQLFGTKSKALVSRESPVALGVENQIIPEALPEAKKINKFSIESNYQNKQMEEVIGKNTSVLAKLDGFFRTFDPQKFAAMLSVAVIAFCLVLNFFAILFVSFKSISNSFMEKIAVKNS
jgi:hypothetical protein